MVQILVIWVVLSVLSAPVLGALLAEPHPAEQPSNR